MSLTMPKSPKNECLTMPGHFLLHAPDIRSFTCQLCRAHHSASLLRSARMRPSSLNPDEPKAPWKCIRKKCGIVLCNPCAEHVHVEFERIRNLKEEGKRINVEAEVKRVLETLQKTADGVGRQKEVGRKENFKPPLAAVSVELPVSDGPLEVDDGDGDEDDEWVLPVVAVRPYTRAVAAAARGRMRSTTVESKREKAGRG